MLNMIGVMAERWRWGGRYVIYSKVGESFGEAQASITNTGGKGSPRERQTFEKTPPPD
jgi:hypothetical protein